MCDRKIDECLVWVSWEDFETVYKLPYSRQHVLERMGPSAADFFRLFMVPGMFHCGGGIGVNTVDWFSSLVQWPASQASRLRSVSLGVAAEIIPATNMIVQIRTRSSCS